MRPALRTTILRSARLFSSTGLMLAIFSPTATTPAAPSAPAARMAPTDATSALPPEVRLRKLHLVRPDLIPYPLSYDVYC